MQYLSIAYDVLAWYLIFGVMLNLGQSDYKVILFMFIQIGFIVAGKAQLYYTNCLSDKTGYLMHALIADQVQNIIVAFLVQLTSHNTNYSSVVIVFFACYQIGSIAFA